MTESASNDHGVQAELTRDLGMVTALSIGVGTMIAAGIFTLSGLAVGYVGSAAIASFLLAALVASLTALTYCEFTSMYPQSGEGYLYARKTFSPPVAYLVGWCLMLGYTASCAFYIASLSVYFNEFIWHAPWESLAGLGFLTALVLLNIKGTKESGSFQVIVTATKIVLLIWFISGGLGHLDWALVVQRFSTDLPAITSTAALVFITFFGFSAIAASAGEIRNPRRTVPAAIFLSMLVVTVLYSLVIIVMVTANLSEYSEAAMGVAARAFLGPIGGMVIVLGALFSMISASNASIIAGSRVAMSMSRHRHLPREIGAINVQTGTPLVAVLLVGGGIGAFTLMLPLESLAHFADSVLLLALILVNAALIAHRRAFPDIDRPFRVPLVPLLPLMGIIANIYLLIQIPLQGHVSPFVLAFVAILLGVVGFLTWKGTEFTTEAPFEAPSRVLAERASTGHSAFRILVPIANPASAEFLVDIAAAVAAEQHGEMLLLRVVTVKDQLSPRLEERYVEQEQPILAQARRQALTHEVAVSSQVRVGRNAGRAILEAARQSSCNLLVLGWRGSTSTARRIMGEVTDHVVGHAAADILLVRPAADGRPPDPILLPTAGGIHATRAEAYAHALALATGARLTLCAVCDPGASDQTARALLNRLEATRDRWQDGISIDCKVLRNNDIAEAIVTESAHYGSVVIGAAGQSFTTQVLFGTIPEQVARRSPATVMVVKHHQPTRALLGRILTE